MADYTGKVVNNVIFPAADDYRVTLVTTDSTGSNTAERRVTVDPPASTPPSPPVPGVPTVTGTQVSIPYAASPTAGVDGYKVDRAAPGETPVMLNGGANIVAPPGPFLDSPPLRGVPYSYRFYAIENGPPALLSSPSPPVTATIDPLTSRALGDFSETFATTGPEFPTKTGLVNVLSSQLRLMQSATVGKSFARTIADIAIVGDGIIIGPITWPDYSSGSGTARQYLTVELPGLDRFVLRRNRVFSGIGAVTSDQVEARLVDNNSDAAPFLKDWSTLPGATDIKYLKIGFPGDGTASYQVSANGTSFTQVTSRAIPTTVDITGLAFLEIGTDRVVGDTIVTGTFAIDNVTGTQTPGAGGGATKSDTALHFDGTQIRVFPAVDYKALLVVMKPTNASKIYVPAGVSKVAGGHLDTFTRADAASIATGGPAWTASVGTLPSIVSNQASSTTTAGNRGALYPTQFGNDNGAWVQVASKPANPASKVFNWHVIQMRIAGTTNTTSNGYILQIALNTDGTTDWKFGTIVNGGMQASFFTIPGATARAFASGDWIGARVVGSTLEAWHKAGSGAWTLVGSTTDTTFTTGTRVGFVTQQVNGVASLVDNFGGGSFGSTSESFPADRGGRYMRITTGRQPQYWDNTLVPASGFGAGTMPATPAYSGVLVSRAASSGQVATRIWDSTTGAFTESENIAVIGAGSTITDSGARFVIGDREPNLPTDMAFVGDIALVATFSDDIGATAFEAAVQGSGAAGVMSESALLGISTITHLYNLTKLALPGDQIPDLKGTNNETTGERIGTNTLTTDVANIPVGTGTGGGGGGGGNASVPDPPSVSVTSVGIDPVATTTGKFTLTIPTTVANADILYTPNASPYGAFWSTSPDGPWTQYGTWQSSPIFAVTGQPLDPGDGSTLRYWTARYRNNGTPSLLTGGIAPPEAVIISASTVSMTPVDDLRDNRVSAGATDTASPDWLLPATEEGVSYYAAWSRPASQAIDFRTDPPDWTGSGTVAAGRVSGPVFTSLLPLSSYRIIVVPARARV